MSYRPPEESKALAATLASLIFNDPENVAGVDLRREAPSAAARRTSSTETVRSAGYSGSIGIWKEMETEEEGPVLIRDESRAADFVYWSATHRIVRQKDRFRVVLLGESVARGFLLDPGYNPAQALGHLLLAAGIEAEVVDLARTNCSIAELEELATQCVALDPDVIVLFAGNNWMINSKALVRPEEITRIINTIVGKGDIAIIREIIEDKLTGMIGGLFGTLAQLNAQPGMSVVVVNPEFNLLDWKSNPMERIPLFTTRELETWYRLLAEAHRLMEAAALPEAEAVCTEMIALYPTNPAGYELLARLRVKQGRPDEASGYSRLAHDTCIYQGPQCPGITSFIQETVRRKCEEAGLVLVDLPDVFQRHLNGGVAGRTLFLDYCHLTVEGINIAMGHTARQIARHKGVSAAPSAAADLPGPEDPVVAAAHFLAALHNAHWGQDLDIVRYHCSKALARFDLSNEMIRYALMAVNSACPWRLNKHFEALIESGTFLQYLLLAQPEEGMETFDLVLTEAILLALEEQGYDVREEVDRLRLAEYAGSSGQIDLLRSYYWLESNYNSNLKLKRASYYRELAPESRFYVPSNGERALTIELVHRLAYRPCNGETIKVKINGKILHTAPASDRWSKELLLLPAELLRTGLNELVISWPLAHVQTKYDKPVDYADLDIYYKHMYPVVGEIHSLYASF